ncbi:hypothetical protein [Paraburkholderia sp. GAS32]|uniref:hypothetical protein n=1 Tax=Paraburkholderia sp. GAS32 TaxID=3035129 RepID=UPI003D1D02DE
MTILNNILARLGLRRVETRGDMQIVTVNAQSELDEYRDYDPEYHNFIDTPTLRVIRVLRGRLVRTLAAGNTFSLFQRFGGVDLSWYEHMRQGMECSRPMSRDECARVVAAMTAWLSSEEADAEMRAVGTDRGYVQTKVDQFASLLAPDGEQAPDHVFNTWSFISVERFTDDDRGLDEMCELADEYADRYWGECADH